MKRLLVWSVLLIFSLSETAGQRLSLPDSNKYRINLPGYWKPGNKIWRILTDKLPLICQELRDKELCGDDCTPLYTIELEISDPVVFDFFPNHILSNYANNQFSRPSEVWDIQTYYGFECSFLLRNEKAVLLTRLILVDTNEVWKISNRVTLASYAPPPPVALYNRRTSPSRSGVVDIYSNPSNLQIIPVTGQEGETPFSFINKNREKLAPGYKDLFAVIDQKISSW